MTPVEYELSQVLLGFGIADFNGDGIEDVVAVNAGNGATTGQDHLYLLSLFTSKGDGTLLPEVCFGSGGIAPAGINGNALALADFNNDGAVDIVGNISGVGAGVLMSSNGTKVVLGSSSGTSHQGQAVTFTTTVSASFRFGGTLGGSVSFYDGEHSTRNRNPCTWRCDIDYEQSGPGKPYHQVGVLRKRKLQQARVKQRFGGSEPLDDPSLLLE